MTRSGRIRAAQPSSSAHIETGETRPESIIEAESAALRDSPRVLPETQRSPAAEQRGGDRRALEMPAFGRARI